jgi:hypothetical protein
MRAEREQQRRLREEWAPQPEDFLLYGEPSFAARWGPAADPHAARSTRAAPAGMRASGIAAWPFRVPRRPAATPACPSAGCDQDG